MSWLIQLTLEHSSTLSCHIFTWLSCETEKRNAPTLHHVIDTAMQRLHWSVFTMSKLRALICHRHLSTCSTLTTRLYDSELSAILYRLVTARTVRCPRHTSRIRGSTSYAGRRSASFVCFNDKPVAPTRMMLVTLQLQPQHGERRATSDLPWYAAE